MLFRSKYTSKDPQRAADVANTTAQTLIKFVNDLRLSEARNQAEHLKAERELNRQQVNAATVRLERYKEAHSIFLYKSEYEARLKVISELEVDLVRAEAALVGSQNTLSTISLAAKRARLIHSIEQRKAELAPLPGIERELSQLEQDLKDAVIAYETVEKQLEQVNLNKGYPMPEARLVSQAVAPDRKSTRLNSSHIQKSRMPSSA